MKKVMFVVNPHSGTKDKTGIEDIIAGNIDCQQYDYDILYTTARGDAFRFATDATFSGTDIIVAVGGDGTVNEVASGISSINEQRVLQGQPISDTSLAIIPCGSGNGFARHIGMSVNPIKAIQQLNLCTRRCIDYGKINGIRFYTTCGVGFDAFVSLEFAQAGKRGPIQYIEKTISNWVKYNPKDYILQTDDIRMDINALLITCGNAAQWGNNCWITPHAHMNDGWLDITIIKPFLTIEAAALGLMLVNKSITESSKVISFKCRHLEIIKPGEGPIHFDGDPMMSGDKIVIDIVPHGLNVMVPYDIEYI